MTELIAHRGDVEQYDVTILDSAGVPINLTDALEIWFTVKRSLSDLDIDAVVQLTKTGGAITATDGPAGKGRITVPAETFADLPDRSIVLLYDVQVKDSLGSVSTPIRGNLTVEPDVTLAN